MSTIGKRRERAYTGVKLCAEEVIDRIEENGGPHGLDLSGKDLSGIILSRRALSEIRRKRQPEIDGFPVWQCRQTGGINLCGADLSWSVLSGADLSRGCLRGADLRGARLDRVDLIDADLRDTFLWDANLDNASLDGADLRGANVFGANLVNTTLSRECFGGSIVQESRDYQLPPNMTMLPERNRFWQGSSVYRTLKVSFENGGAYSDASWAYRGARRMEKHLAAYHARIAWQAGDWRQFARQASKRVSDEIVEWLCDYGESIGRVLAWLCVLWLSFALIYGLLGGVLRLDVPGTRRTTRSVADLLAFSLATMVTIEPAGLVTTGSGMMRFLMPIEAFLGIALTGLLGFVLGNRISHA